MRNTKRNIILFILAFLFILFEAINLASTINVHADGAGGSVTICTVKQADGRLLQCTPVPGNPSSYILAPQAPAHVKPQPKNSKPSPTATACYYGPNNAWPCPAVPNKPTSIPQPTSTPLPVSLFTPTPRPEPLIKLWCRHVAYDGYGNVDPINSYLFPWYPGCPYTVEWR